MKAPDKIYIEQDMIDNIPLEQKEFDDDVEYIRKDAILEWAKEVTNDTNHSLAYRGAFRDLIDKINSL